MGLYKNIVQFDYNLEAGEYVSYIYYPFGEYNLDPIFKILAIYPDLTADLELYRSFRLMTEDVVVVSGLSQTSFIVSDLDISKFTIGRLLKLYSLDFTQSYYTYVRDISGNTVVCDALPFVPEVGQDIEFQLEFPVHYFKQPLNGLRRVKLTPLENVQDTAYSSGALIPQPTIKEKIVYAKGI